MSQKGVFRIGILGFPLVARKARALPPMLNNWIFLKMESNLLLRVLNFTRLLPNFIYDYLWGECSLVRWLGDRLCWLFYWGSIGILIWCRIWKGNRLVLKRWSKSWSWWLGLRIDRTGLCKNWFFHWTTGYMISWRWLIGLYWSWFWLKRASYWCPFSIDDFWCL